jgi:hypothetical protein
VNTSGLGLGSRRGQSLDLTITRINSQTKTDYRHGFINRDVFPGGEGIATSLCHGATTTVVLIVWKDPTPR